MGLSIVTLDIYALYRFYVAGAFYERVARREPNPQETKERFATLFWLFVGSWVIAGQATRFGVAGVLVWVPIATGILLLARTLDLRNAAVRSIGCAEPENFSTKGTHLAFWIGGVFLVVLGIGVALLALQAWFFFREFNAVLREVAREQGTPLPEEPPSTPRELLSDSELGGTAAKM